MMPFFLFLIWIIYVSIDGASEALCDQNSKEHKYNKKMKIVQRLLVASFIIIAYYNKTNWVNPCVLLTASMALSFSFFHNGFYFIAMNYFSGKKIYKRAFRECGIGVLFEFDFLSRTIMMVISIVIVALLVICQN